MAQLDRVFGEEEKGYCYARHDNPSTAALEELMCELESGDAALACASGMAALHTAILSALTDRRRSIVAANAMYGATVGLLMNVFEPSGVSISFADICDLEALRAAVAEARPGCIVMESISNPLLRVGEIDKIAAHRQRGGSGAGGGQHVRHAAAGAPAGTGRAFQRTQRHQISGGPRRRAGRRGGDQQASMRIRCARWAAPSVRCWARLKAT